MSSSITLVITRGPIAGQKFTFSGPTRCTIGRSRDCTIALPLEPEHLDVSRHHCEMEISPEGICVRDLGSLNGTYVNGRKIGQRAGPEAAADGGPGGPPTIRLTDGDEVRMGEHTAFRVCVAAAEVARPRRASSGELPACR